MKVAGPIEDGSEAVATGGHKGYGRWRAGTLILVHVLIAVHIVHWRLAGKTLAPLELHEVMYTLEFGVVTAGFLFMALALVSVVLFGRFFCGWACHLMALQELSSWILGKLGIRVRPVRSRLLLVVPLAALFYMFVWPQVARAIQGRPFPELRVADDAEGWASFVTTDYWRNLPPLGVALGTFLVCGGAIVYFLGSRSFCRYACPYGALFGLADKLALGRIKATGPCEMCGRCTAACTSDIRVHEELAAYGAVISSSCMKDLDCVAACPHGAVGYGLGRPALLRWRGEKKKPLALHGFTWPEELWMAGTFLVSLFVYRGLYGRIPFLMALGLSCVLSLVGVVALRLVRGAEVKVGHLRLGSRAGLAPSGRAFALAALLIGLLTLHSAFVHYRAAAGEAAYERVVHAAGGLERAPEAEIEGAIGHLEAVERWGLLGWRGNDRRLVVLHLASSAPEEAEPYLRSILERAPHDLEARLRLARVLYASGRAEQGERQLDALLSAVAARGGEERARIAGAGAHRLLGSLAAEQGRKDVARGEFEAALALRPEDAAARRAIAELLADEGEFQPAIEHLGAALAADPDGDAATLYNRAVLLARVGRAEEAIADYRAAARLAPDDPEIHNNLGLALAQQGDLAGAEAGLREALRAQPDFASAHFNLGRVLMSGGRIAEGCAAIRRAAELDEGYAEYVRRNPLPVARE